MKVVVLTGSRDWSDRAAIEHVLLGAELLIVGDCPTGADAIALELATAWDIIPVVLRADWDTHGRPKAAYLRNQAIADRAALERASGMDVCCYAFPLAGSRGTYDCKRRLEAHGFVVTMAPENA